MTRRRLTHECPGRCGRAVPNDRYACIRCWFRLPSEIRQAITRNYRVDPQAHAEAMLDAARWYGAAGRSVRGDAG